MAAVAVVGTAALLVAVPFATHRNVPGTAVPLGVVVGWLVVVGVGVDVFQGNRTVARILQPPPDENRPAVLAAAIERRTMLGVYEAQRRGGALAVA